MKKLFLKIYYFFTEPLYQRLLFELKVELQKAHESHLKLSERHVKLFVDEMVRYSYTKAYNETMTGSESLLHSLPEELFEDRYKQNFTDEEICGVLNSINTSGGLIEASLKHSIPITTLLRWHAKFNGTDIRGTTTIRSMETEIAQLKSLITDMSMENKILRERVSASEALSNS